LQINGKPVVDIRSNPEVIVRVARINTEKNEIQPPDIVKPPTLINAVWSKKGLSILTAIINGEKSITFLNIYPLGISPIAATATGNMKKEIRPDISYFPKESTITINKIVTRTFALGSTLCIYVFPRDRASSRLKSSMAPSMTEIYPLLIIA